MLHDARVNLYLGLQATCLQTCSRMPETHAMYTQGQYTEGGSIPGV